MLWAEHGGAWILKVGDLKFSELAEAGEEAGFFLELELSPAETVVHKIEGFAAKHSPTLAPLASPGPSCSVHPVLAACHIPGQKRFIFAEESRLEAGRVPRGSGRIPGPDRALPGSGSGDSSRTRGSDPTTFPSPGLGQGELLICS
jgi:hypothetical protein